ncbi:MAG: hypothetical protein V1870_05310 [Candidatus Aenigmatarchaeota archaeon]
MERIDREFFYQTKHGLLRVVSIHCSYPSDSLRHEIIPIGETGFYLEIIEQTMKGNDVRYHPHINPVNITLHIKDVDKEMHELYSEIAGNMRLNLIPAEITNNFIPYIEEKKSFVLTRMIGCPEERRFEFELTPPSSETERYIIVLDNKGHKKESGGYSFTSDGVNEEIHGIATKLPSILRELKSEITDQLPEIGAIWPILNL